MYSVYLYQSRIAVVPAKSLSEAMDKVVRYLVAPDSQKDAYQEENVIRFKGHFSGLSGLLVEHTPREIQGWVDWDTFEAYRHSSTVKIDTLTRAAQTLAQ